MHYRAFLAILAALLVGCGGPQAISDPTAAVVTPVAMPVPTEALFPTGAPEPTLTHDERTQVALMDNRASAMIAAAGDLQRLGQEIRATVAWKGKVHAAATTITAGQHAI
jgi:hypothetical protein